MNSRDEEQEKQLLEYNLATLSYDEKIALREAQELAPDIVERDSPISSYFRFAEGDPLVAAKQMAKYWETRKSLFEEHALKLMSQTGEGTLIREDIAALTSGFLALLPRDHMNRSIVCLDMSRVASISDAVFLRNFFYVWSVVSQNPVSQKQGSIFIMV